MTQMRISMCHLHLPRSGLTNGFFKTSVSQHVPAALRFGYFEAVVTPVACHLVLGIARFITITYVRSTVNGDVFALCLVHQPASIGVCHGMRFCTSGSSACVTSNNSFICKAGLKHASSITENLLVMRAAYHPTDGSNALWNGHLLEVAVAVGLEMLGPHSWKLLRELWGGC